MVLGSDNAVVLIVQLHNDVIYACGYLEESFSVNKFFAASIHC